MSEQTQWAARALRLALRQGVAGEEDPALVFYDLNGLEDAYRGLEGLFAPHTLHALAVKAAPLPGLLAHLTALGAGLEAASLPELFLALAAGCPPGRIVFDSPAKTLQEIRQALQLGVHINADNLCEVERLEGALVQPARASLGLRVNPQVGEGAIACTSVAGIHSKFGEPLSNRKAIVESFAARPWLTGLHMHVGSQGCGLELFLRGVRGILDLRGEINRAAGWAQVSRVDIGGGLPVSYRAGQSAPSMAEYARALARECPELFRGDLRVFTEFGRWLFARRGFAASKVEYVKHCNGKRTAVIHLGADMFPRTCYMPETWTHELAVADGAGHLRPGADGAWDVAGPLCFAGDYLARDRQLPEIHAGDYVLVLDAGAYTLAMWSRYNSRQMPQVIGVRGEELCVLKERESVERVVDFWR